MVNQYGPDDWAWIAMRYVVEQELKALGYLKYEGVYSDEASLMDGKPMLIWIPKEEVGFWEENRTVSPQVLAKLRPYEPD